MIRKFKFEDQIYESLSCLPMAARRKLDALGNRSSRLSTKGDKSATSPVFYREPHG